MDEALEESIKQHVKTKLEAHAYPREVELMKELPRTKTGKILKQELRRLHEEKSKKGKR
jgi:acetyl-CoA synthetase